MSDLKAEIEARRARLAEFRRQRDGHAAYAPRAALELVVPAAPQIAIPAPFLYTKSTQTEHNLGEENEAVKEEEHNRKENKEENHKEEEEAEEANASQFVLNEATHVSPRLLTFVDDSWRAIARSGAGRTLTDYRQPPAAPRAPAAATDALAVHETAALDGSFRLGLSPFYAALVATARAGRRELAIFDVAAPAAPEFTLKCPTQLSAQIVFSPALPRLVFGAGRNGQVFAWDLGGVSGAASLDDAAAGLGGASPGLSTEVGTLGSVADLGGRFGRLPTLRSPIDASPVVGLAALGRSALVTVNEDAVVKVWAADRLSRPLSELVLEDALRASMARFRLPVLVPTALAVLTPRGFAQGLGFGWKEAVVGTISGHLLRLPRSATQADEGEVWRHAAAVTCLDLISPEAPAGGAPGATSPGTTSPGAAGTPRAAGTAATSDATSALPDTSASLDSASGTVEAADEAASALLLSGGLDWYIRCWRLGAAPHLLQQFHIAYAVQTVAWRDARVFAAGGEHTVEIYRLGARRPLVAWRTEHAVEDVKFGRSLVVATAGGVLVYDVPELD